MSKWITELQSVIRKEETRPQGNWKTKFEIVEIIKSSTENCHKFLQWALKNNRVRMKCGTSLTTSRILTSKTFYNPIKKDWKCLYFDYAKSKEKRPKGNGWKTFTQLCRELRLSETHGRKAISLLIQNKKIEIFKGGIVDDSSRVTAIKFYRIRG